MTSNPRRQSPRKNMPPAGPHSRRLHVPHRSRHVPVSAWTTYDDEIPQAWQVAAIEKGFIITRRVRDRYHVALECMTCGAETLQKAYVVRTARPQCAACLDHRRQMEAAACGYTLLGRDDTNHKYGSYKLPCGHVVSLQFGRVSRLARDGRVPGRPGSRCPECHTAKIAGLAAKRGWTLVGPDPEGNANYRVFRHQEGCGHEQRIAVANLQSGRFGCARCGEVWSAAPSCIYFMEFVVPDRGTYIKLGYSKNPESRLHWQLGLSRKISSRILHQLAMPTGHQAQKLEKKLHNTVRHRFPDAVVPTSELAGWINVVSEIYRPAILPDILTLLETIAAKIRSIGENRKPNSGKQN